MKCESVQGRYARMLQILAMGGSVSDQVLKQLERELKEVLTRDHSHVAIS